MGKPTSDTLYFKYVVNLRIGHVFGLQGIDKKYLFLNKIGKKKRTRGTETSKYPKERTSTETPVVVASETGPGDLCA